MPTPAARERNRRTQQALRDRRKANSVRVTIWLPREVAADLHTLADVTERTHTELLTGWITSARATTPGQGVLT